MDVEIFLDAGIRKDVDFSHYYFFYIFYIFYIIRLNINYLLSSLLFNHHFNYYYYYFLFII